MRLDSVFIRIVAPFSGGILLFSDGLTALDPAITLPKVDEMPGGIHSRGIAVNKDILSQWPRFDSLGMDVIGVPQASITVTIHASELNTI